MDGKRLLHSLSLKNFLSYGSEGVTLDLQPLNVFIGPNASGKSNALEAIGLFRAAPTNLMAFVYQGGGVQDYLYKGNGSPIEAQLAVEVEDAQVQDVLRHSLGFTSTDSGQRLQN